MAAVVIIVLLVGAVGAFYVFSDKRAGQATRTLTQSQPQPTQPSYPTAQPSYPLQTYPSQQTTTSTGNTQPPVMTSVDRPPTVVEIGDECPKKPTCTKTEVEMLVVTQWFSNSSWGGGGVSAGFKKELMKKACAEARSEAAGSAFTCVEDLIAAADKDCVYGAIVCAKKSVVEVGCVEDKKLTFKYWPKDTGDSSGEIGITVTCTCKAEYECDP